MTAFDKHLNILDDSLVQGIEWEPQKVSASLVIGREEHKVWVAANEDLFQEADFLLPVALLPAMRAGATLKLPGGVSPRLLSSVWQIQDILNMWESIYKHIPVRAEARGTTAGRGSGVACFFGGGVDSFHTTLKHYEEISHLVFLHRRLTEDPSVAEETEVRRARKVAEGLGKSLVEVETNLHAFSIRTRVPWRFYHGMWIASTALLLQHKFRKVLIPGSTTSNYDNLRPQGTHPILDPLWSTELVDFHHDGCEVRRVDKAAYIASHEVAMQYLQVCDVTGGSHNCGHCKKCLRSMLNLKSAGALEQCETLPNEIDSEAVRGLDLSEYSESYFARENLRALERLGTEPDLVRALEEALHRGGRIIAHSGYKEENLDAMRSKLEASRQRAEKLRENNSRLKAKKRRLAQENSTLAQKNQELAVENAQLATRYSSLRYRLADTAAQIVFRIPGAARLLEKRGPRVPS